MIVEKTDMSVGVREELVMCVDDHQGKLVGLQRSLEIGFCVEGSGSVTSRKCDKCEDVFVCSDYCFSKPCTRTRVFHTRLSPVQVWVGISSPPSSSCPRLLQFSVRVRTHSLGSVCYVAGFHGVQT